MDHGTREFYEHRAAEWAAALPSDRGPQLDAFLDRLPPRAAVLELGCGDGRDAQYIEARGFTVSPSDGSPAMARLASERLGREVPVMEFAEIDAVEAFDGAWCRASLHHLREAGLAPVLVRIHRALKPGGWHYASYKSGTDGGRDAFGRYFSYIARDRLEAAYRKAAPWSDLVIDTQLEGRSFGGAPTDWHHVLARK